jgi:hypothetical protein
MFAAHDTPQPTPKSSVDPVLNEALERAIRGDRLAADVRAAMGVLGPELSDGLTKPRALCA